MPPGAHPAGGIDYPRTYQEFRPWFPDDQACRERSHAGGMLFYRFLQQAVDADPHPLKDLIGG